MQKGTLMKWVSHSSVMLLLFFLAISQVYAAPITTLPPGLNPGDQYRLAFVTSNSYRATTPVIHEYNLYVQDTASSVLELAALNTVWFAIASTPGPATDARDNTGTNPYVEPDVPIYNLAGQLIANDNYDLWDGELLNPILYTELGTASSAQFVWTGTMPDGSVGLPLGDAWGLATVGNPHFADPVWIDFMPQHTDELNALYGISGPLTAPVPLPSAILLFGTGLIGLAGFRRKFKK